MDNMALTSRCAADVEKLKSGICEHWEITDGGEMHWYLGFQINHDHTARTISINQQAYIKAMLEKFQLTNIKPVTIPMVPGVQLTKEQGPSTLKQIVAMHGVVKT